MIERSDAETSPIASDGPRRGGLGPRPGWRFDGFEFDCRRGELRDSRQAPVALRPKAEALLRLFLSEPGRLFSKDELIATLWAHTAVTDDSLVQCVGELRIALGASGPRLIRTVPRRGYRWEGAVEPLEPVSDDAASGHPVAKFVAPGAAPPPAAEGATAAVGARRTRRLGAAALLLVLSASLGVLGWWVSARPAVHIDQELTALNTIAVMPFVATPDDAALRKLGERVGDEIVEQVSLRIGMRALGRTLLLAADGQPLPYADIAGRFGATRVVTGRIARTADARRVAIDLQLAELRDGTVLWTRHVERAADRDPTASFDVGQHVANAVRNQSGTVEAIRLKLLAHEPDPVALTMLGYLDIERRRTPDDLARARGRFESALRADPESTLALNGLAITYAIEGSDPRLQLSSAQLAAEDRVVERMRERAPNDATCLLVWSSVQMSRGHADMALPAIDKANRLSPSYANGHVLRAQALLLLGRPAEVPAEADRALELSDGSRDASAAYGLSAEAALALGDIDRAASLARRSTVERPGNYYAFGTLAAAEALAGHRDQAGAAIDGLRALWPTVTVSGFDRVRASPDPLYLAQRARLYEGLRRAGLRER